MSRVGNCRYQKDCRKWKSQDGEQQPTLIHIDRMFFGLRKIQETVMLHLYLANPWAMVLCSVECLVRLSQ